MRVRTFGLLYHKKASDTSVYYIPDMTIGYVTLVAAACVVVDESVMLFRTGSLETGNGLPPS